MIEKHFYTEAAYLAGIAALAFGTALMELADFGMAEYTLQALLLILLAVVMRRFRMSYLFSFCTAVLYGFVLDECMAAIGMLPADMLIIRLACFVVGLMFCATGVSLFFHTYISPEAYELIVMGISAKFRFPTGRVKTVYDCVSCLLSILLSFAFFGFGKFEGIKLGTILCALVNGWLIGRFNRFFEGHFIFCDLLPLRKYFQ